MHLEGIDDANLLHVVRQANQLTREGDLVNAVKLYTDAIGFDPNSYILYGNRSAALSKLGKHSRALQDAIRARELNPRWSKAFYRQGIALQGLGRHADSLAAFASGLALEHKSVRLLVAFVETAMKSPFRASLEPIYRQLQAMQLDKSPFVVTSVVGQDLLSNGHKAAAIVILESALRIGTCSMKLRGSVYSALSTAYWELGDLDKALQYMQSDLQISKSLGDQLGECRAHGNLGAAHYARSSYKESLSSHRNQLVLALKGKFMNEATSALTSLGHVYTTIGDLTNALASHRQCLQIVRQVNDREKECIEIGNIATVLLALGDTERAIGMLEEQLRMAIESSYKLEKAKALCNLSSLYRLKGQYEEANNHAEQLLVIAQEINDKNVEVKAFAELGHTAKCLGKLGDAKKFYSRQLEVAITSRSRVNEAKACSNLGTVYQLMSDFDGALKLHWTHLQIAKELRDASAMGIAYANIGACYSSLNKFDEAFKYTSFMLANGSKKAKSICSN